MNWFRRATFAMISRFDSDMVPPSTSGLRRPDIIAAASETSQRLAGDASRVVMRHGAEGRPDRECRRRDRSDTCRGTGRSLILGWARLRTGGLTAPIAIHMATNALAVWANRRANV